MTTKNDYHKRLLEVYNNLCEGCGKIAIKRDAISIIGPDAAKFLQGQMTQDISVLQEGMSVYSFLLRPDGRVVAFVRVSRLSDDHFFLDTDHGWGAVVAERLERFKIRTKVTIELPEYHCVSLRGPLSNDVLGLGDTNSGDISSGLNSPHSTGSGSGSPYIDDKGKLDVGELYTIGDGVIAISLSWNWPLTGYDLFSEDPSAIDRLVGDLPEYPRDIIEALAEILRIEAGLPSMGREIDSNTIPAYTAILDRVVSFGKGCYVGQELVERIDSRGSHTPKRLCRLVERNGITPLDTLDLSAITSTAWSPRYSGYVCMGYVPRKINVGDIIVLQGTSSDSSSEDVTGNVLNATINDSFATSLEKVSGSSAPGSPIVDDLGHKSDSSELAGRLFEVMPMIPGVMQ